MSCRRTSRSQPWKRQDERLRAKGTHMTLLNEKPSMNERQVAERLGVTVACLRRMRREHRGPAWFKMGRLVRYEVAAVERYIQSNTVTGDELLKKSRVELEDLAHRCWDRAIELADRERQPA